MAEQAIGYRTIFTRSKRPDETQSGLTAAIAHEAGFQDKTYSRLIYNRGVPPAI